MKKHLVFLFLFFFLAVQAQSDETKMFIFGHSLIDHRPPAIPTPSNETTVPHWIYLLAQEAGDDYAVGGQYGFLPQHANLPPISQWGYDLVPGVWESDTEPFSDADITTVLITPGNFMQWQDPDLEYPSDPGITPISATQTILDWVSTQEDSVSYYIYENWPDMAPYLNNDFPPTASEFAAYNEYTWGEFNDWWLDYHDALLDSHPELCVRMIPVGPVIAEILQNFTNNQIPMTELYEDNAPHGRPTVYFLAGLITYMAVYEQEAPASFVVPDIVHSVVRDNYLSIVDFIWAELHSFNDASGDNRVFCTDITSSQDDLQIDNTAVSIFPNPSSNVFNIVSNTAPIQEIRIYNVLGETVYSKHQINTTFTTIDINEITPQILFIDIKTEGDQHIIKFVKS